MDSYAELLAKAFQDGRESVGKPDDIAAMYTDDIREAVAHAFDAGFARHSYQMEIDITKEAVVDAWENGYESY